ncbi:MAG: FG-GAP-like repeat-containing protein [Pirellulales bacterium]
MNRQAALVKAVLRAGLCLAAILLPVARWFASPNNAAGGVVEIGPAAETRVPRWDARGLGALAWQGIACLDASDDGRAIAVGTMAPPGDPNLFVLDDAGRAAAQHRAGFRWLDEVTLTADGRLVTALSTTPEGTAGDTPRFYGFRDGKELPQVAKFQLRDFFFHYGEHSNHVPRVSCSAGQQWVVADDERVSWVSNDGAVVAQAPLGQGTTMAVAASPGGLVVVGRLAGGSESAMSRGLLVLRPDKAKPIVWARDVGTDVARSPRPEPGVYGPAVPPYDDVKFQAPLSVAIDRSGKHVAVADYEGWQRTFHPRDGREDIAFGTRFMPSRPTIHVFGVEGKLLRRIGPEAFGGPLWCDMAFLDDGSNLLVWPHRWASRGLAGQPFLPADDDARTLYVCDVASESVTAVRFPDAIASASTRGQCTAVGCWDGKVYVLDRTWRPIPTLPTGRDMGAASLVRVCADGRRIAVATAAGIVSMLDAEGKELWRTDLNQAARHGDKPWTRNQKAERLAPGVWGTNGGLAHSDLGRQTLIEAPRGLLLVDPNAAASFEQNWARIEGAGFDPMKVKYVLLTHEHGDHAPGASLWRAITGAQVVASAEMAYILQHHIPGGTGYGLHPPVPVDIVLTGEKELDLAGLKVKVIRLPGHTFGSMGYVFEKNGQKYVATGDLIMQDGVLGYSGSLDFSAEDVLASLTKLAALKPDVVLGGHGWGAPDEFIAKGIEAGEATGWSRMTPPKPDPFCRFMQRNYLVAAWLEPIAAAAYGDVDGDGRPDVAVLVSKAKGAAVKIYLNRGGQFAAAPDAVVDLAGLGSPSKLRMIHLGGKGTDFFVSSESRAVLLRGQPERLAFKAVPLEITRGTNVAPGDFNGDGLVDLVVGSRFVGGYYLAYQQSDGSFQVRQSATRLENYMGIALADVNGDRREDLIVSSGDVFLRHPDGTLAETPAFRLAVPMGSEGKGWTFLAAADFDRDGRTDVALLANTNQGAAVWLYRNTRKPGQPFSPEPGAKFVLAETIVNRDGPTVADWNGDGAADLILCKGGKQPGAAILPGSRADGLSPERIVSINLDYTPYHDARFGVADFSGDGRMGLAGFGPSPTGAVGVYVWLRPHQ